MNNLQIAVKAYLDAHGTITESVYEELSKVFGAESVFSDVHESAKGERSKLESELNKRFKSLISALNNCKKSPSKYIDEVQEAAKSFSEVLKDYYGECRTATKAVNESTDVEAISDRIEKNAEQFVAELKEMVPAIRGGRITKSQLEEKLKKHMSDNITLVINALTGTFDNFIEAVSKHQDANMTMRYIELGAQVTAATKFVTKCCKFESVATKMIEQLDKK